MKKRRAFTAEFKREAVRLVRERGLPVARTAQQIDIHENVLRKWVRDFEADPTQAFPGQGKLRPEQAEIERLRREVARLKMERDARYIHDLFQGKRVFIIPVHRQGGVMKHSMLVAVFLVLGACQSAPTTFDESSTLYPPPPGSRFTLKQELTIPAHSAHVDLQGGLAVSLSKLNQYHPYCRLDVQDVRETPQSVLPDEFLVKRVYRQITDVVARRSGLVRVRRVSDEGGPTFMIYRTVFELKSARQPQVRRLTCEHWDRPALGDHLSLRQIRTALGEFFTVTLPGEATSKE